MTMTNSTIFDLPKLLFVPGYKLIYSDIATQQEYEVESIIMSSPQGLILRFNRFRFNSLSGEPLLNVGLPIDTVLIWSENSVIIGKDSVGALHLQRIHTTPNLLTVHTTED
jgi:hypothetical protein